MFHLKRIKIGSCKCPFYFLFAAQINFVSFNSVRHYARKISTSNLKTVTELAVSRYIYLLTNPKCLFLYLAFIFKNHKLYCYYTTLERRLCMVFGLLIVQSPKMKPWKYRLMSLLGSSSH